MRKKKEVLGKNYPRTFYLQRNNLLLGDYMDYKVIINPELGGKDVGGSYNGQTAKDYNLRFSKLLSSKLNDMGISNLLLRSGDKTISNIERINMIKQNSSPNTIILTNGLDSEGDIEIIYPLRSDDVLASRLATGFTDNDFNVSKFYQQRSSSNSSVDADSILASTTNPSVIIRYGDISKNNDYLNGRIDELVDVVANTLRSYLGLANDYYIVKKGDNLYSIAQKYNTTVDNIKKLNNLSSNNLSIGQKLIIKSIPSTKDDGNIYYIVKKGDNLYSIARQYETTVSKLKQLNNLTSNLLSIGQRLIVKKNNANSNQIYIVKKGDTLYQIARLYNVSVVDLKRVNGLTNDILTIGMNLIIPNK